MAQSLYPHLIFLLIVKNKIGCSVFTKMLSPHQGMIIDVWGNVCILYLFFVFYPLFLPNFMISNYDLVSSLQLPNGLGRGEG
jgi:hypothetical protein